MLKFNKCDCEELNFELFLNDQSIAANPELKGKYIEFLTKIPNLSEGAKNMWHFLAVSKHDDPNFTTSFALLADLMGRCVVTIRRRFKELENTNLIKLTTIRSKKKSSLE